jgi:hypothetical protein
VQLCHRIHPLFRSFIRYPCFINYEDDEEDDAETGTTLIKGKLTWLAFPPVDEDVKLVLLSVYFDNLKTTSHIRFIASEWIRLLRELLVHLQNLHERGVMLVPELSLSSLYVAISQVPTRTPVAPYLVFQSKTAMHNLLFFDTHLGAVTLVEPIHNWPIDIIPPPVAMTWMQQTGSAITSSMIVSGYYMQLQTLHPYLNMDTSGSHLPNCAPEFWYSVPVAHIFLQLLRFFHAQQFEVLKRICTHWLYPEHAETLASMISKLAQYQ